MQHAPERVQLEPAKGSSLRPDSTRSQPRATKSATGKDNATPPGSPIAHAKGPGTLQLLPITRPWPQRGWVWRNCLVVLCTCRFSDGNFSIWGLQESTHTLADLVGVGAHLGLGYHWGRQVQGNVAKAACEPRYLSMALSLSLTSDPSPLHPPSLSPTPDAALGKAKTAQSLQPLNPLSSVPLGSERTVFRVEAPLIPVPTLHCRVTPPWERAFA